MIIPISVDVYGEHAVIDLDDVVFDFAKKANKLCNQLGKQVCYEDYREYDLPKFHGINTDRFYEIINQHDLILKVMPFDFVQRAFGILRDKGYFINLVTARGVLSEGSDKTIQSLEAHRIAFDTLDVVDTRVQPKSDVYSQWGNNVAFLADDAPYNLEDAMRSGIELLPACIHAPWNAEDDRFSFGVNRFRNILDLAHAVNPARPV